MDTPMSSGYGETASRESSGGAAGISPGLEQLLRRIGVSDAMIENIRTSLQDVNLEEYLDDARNLLRENAEKAKDFARENPGKIAAGAVLLAVGVGLLISATKK